MILIEQSSTAQPSKAPIDQRSPPDNVDVPPAPPAYREQEEALIDALRSPADESEPLLPAKHRPSSAVRLWRAVAIAVTVILLFLVVTVSLVLFNRPHEEIAPKGWPLPSDGTARECVGGQDWEPHPSPDFSFFPHWGRTTFKVPLSPGLFMIARGSSYTGSLTIVDSPELRGDYAHVEVLASYGDRGVLDHSNVCLLQRENISAGVGIFTPKLQKKFGLSGIELTFNVTVHLPAGTIDDFRTNLPFFIHTIGDLAGKINFKHISLSGSYGPIHATSLQAEYASISTSNEFITGQYNASQYIELLNDKGVTKADITLSNDPSSNVTTTCLLQNTDLVIDSTISLQSSAGEGGSFNVTAKTLHGPLRVKFTDAPVNSILNHLAETFNSPVTVELPSNYEGSFYLRSSGMSPSVATRRDHDDPYRLRYLDIEQTGNKAIKGWTSWSPPHFPYDEEKGHVDIKTSNSPIHLYL